MIDFKLPDLGEGVHEGQILAVHVKEGQAIQEDELLLEVETDKAAVEIPSPCTGTVTTVHVKDKQLVHVGDVMVTFSTDAKCTTEPVQIETEIEGVQEQTEFGIVIRQPMSQAWKAISKAMSHAWETIPHVTDCNDADITDIDAMRKNFKDPDQPNLKLTLLPFVLKAVCRSLAKYPILNATICPDTGDVLFRKYVNIAIGVNSDRGLIAPVIRNVDQLSVGEISAQLDQITANARSASFTLADTKGATYTISNAGAVGRTRYSTPIIQIDTVACLAVGRARLMPWVVDSEIVPRLILPLSHSIDHRLIDGGREIPFIEHLINDLEHPMRFAV